MNLIRRKIFGWKGITISHIGLQKFYTWVFINKRYMIHARMVQKTIAKNINRK